MVRHEENIFACTEVREEPAVLDHVADASAQFGNIRGGDGGAVEANGARVGIEKANDEP